MDLTPVSVLIPCLNEEAFIVNCIESILSGSYELDKLEILVIDGGSADNTINLVKELQEKHPQIRIINNPKTSVPAALNIGRRESTHEHLIWLGAHAIYDKHYISNSIRTLLSNKVASVGGVITPVGRSYLGRAIAIATQAMFGIGNAKYRYATTPQHVDTVFGGCWTKTTLSKIGGFNECWKRNQDYELNTRLRKQIGPILLNPEIKCEYFCRDRLPCLARQYFEYGYWRFRTLIKHPSTLNIRVLAPPIFVIGSAASIISMPFFGPLTAMPLIVYLSISFLISIYLSIKHKQYSTLLFLPLIFLCIHLSWGLGFITSITNHLMNRK